MAYTPTDWVDGVTPLSEANLDKIEQALAKMPYGPDFSNGRIPVYNTATGLWSNQLIFNGQIDPAAAIAISKLAGYPADVTKFLRGDGTWAVVAAGGGGGTDWEGPWLAGTAYVKGDVVTYNGVTYVAVNDSTGQTPPPANQIPQTFTPIPLVTALPATPFDGQEVIFTDSLTAPTYAWRLRYVAAKASNRWVFIGGSPIAAEVVTGETVTIAAYGNLATIGPSIAIPIAGDYQVNVQYRLSGADAVVSVIYMSYDIGATGAVDADATIVAKDNTVNALYSSSRESRKSFGAVTLVAKYKRSAGNPVLANRLIRATPLAVGG